MLFVACPALGLVEFKDGLTHDIDYAVNDNIRVDYEAPSMYTTVNVLTGTSNCSVWGYEDSRINILGGDTWDLYSYDSTQVNISGGWISNDLCSYGSSQVNITGGNIYDLHSRGSSHVSISGGTIYNSFDIGYYSIVDIYYGGWIAASFIGPRDASQVNIYGGVFGDLKPYYRSTIRIFGSDFAVDGQPVGYGELTSIIGFEPSYEPRRHLTGTLLSGESISRDFYIGHEAKIILIPEPATIALLGIGGLLLGRNKKFSQKRK